MKFSIRFADQIVGTLVLVALVILVAVVFLIGRNQRWFMRDLQYITYLDSANGLSNNMAVQFRGFTIGNVRRFELTEFDNVQVVFTIFEEHSHRVKEGSVVELNASPIGLGNSFIFFQGLGEELLPEGSVIPEATSPQAKQLIAMGLTDRPETADSITNIINNVNTLLENINISLAGSEGAEELVLGQILLNLEQAVAGIPSIIQNVEEQAGSILENFAALSEQIVESGAVESLLAQDGPVLAAIEDALGSVAGIMDSLERTAAFVPAQLPQIAVLFSDLQSMLRETERLVIALNNNPLLRRGVPPLTETGPGAATPRDLEF